MSVHYQEDEPTSHQNESQCRDNLASKRVSVFASQLSINCLNNQGWEGFVDLFVEMEDFGIEDDSKVLMFRNEPSVGFIVWFRQNGLSKDGAQCLRLDKG